MDFKSSKTKILIIIGIIALISLVGFFAINQSKKQTASQEAQIKELPLEVENIPLTVNVVDRPEGKVLECKLKNNSNQDITKLVIEGKLKDTGELITLEYNNTIKSNSESDIFIGKAPASGNKDDFEILKYKISTSNGVYMEYDVNLRQYNWS